MMTYTTADVLDQCQDLIERAEHHISLVLGDAPYLVEHTESWRELVKENLSDINAMMSDSNNPLEMDDWYAVQDMRNALETEFVRLYFAQYPESTTSTIAVREMSRLSS